LTNFSLSDVGEFWAKDYLCKVLGQGRQAFYILNLYMPSGAVGVRYALHYFQSLPGLGSSDRRHFLFCIMSKIFTPIVFPQEILKVLYLNYFEKLLLGYFFYWGRQGSVSTFKVSKIAQVFNESQSEVIRSVKKMENYDYIKVEYTILNNEVQYLHLSINIENIN